MEVNQRRGRNALRQAVDHRRAALGPETLSSRGDVDLAISRDRLRCDVVEFDELLASGQKHEALELVRGGLLPGFHVSRASDFERWLDEERENLRRRAAGAARELAREHVDREDFAGAALWERRAIEFAPYDEDGMRQLLRTLGNRIFNRPGPSTVMPASGVPGAENRLPRVVVAWHAAARGPIRGRGGGDRESDQSRRAG